MESIERFERQEHNKTHIHIVEYELKERLKEIFEDQHCDKRWLAIARTHFEQGFMALVRSNYQHIIDKIDGSENGNWYLLDE